MTYILKLFLRAPFSFYIFLSGVFTSSATNILTSDSTQQGYASILGLTFSFDTVKIFKIVILFIVGLMLFFLATIRENTSRVADFARGTHTTLSEYCEIEISSVEHKSTSIIAGILLIFLSLGFLFLLSS